MTDSPLYKQQLNGIEWINPNDDKITGIIMYNDDSLDAVRHDFHIGIRVRDGEDLTAIAKVSIPENIDNKEDVITQSINNDERIVSLRFIDVREQGGLASMFDKLTSEKLVSEKNFREPFLTANDGLPPDSETIPQDKRREIIERALEAFDEVVQRSEHMLVLQVFLQHSHLEHALK